MATTPVLITVEEYLRTSYRPDRDYVDGEVLERNMGEKPHARLQGFFFLLLTRFASELNAEVLMEQRFQINSSRFRIPDVMLSPLVPDEPLIVRSAPLLCVEILSSEDRWRRVEERILDYASVGVRTSWVIDPWRRLAYVAGGTGELREERGTLTVPNTRIAIAVDEVFAELDRLEALTQRPSLD
jgi:Uma2 family endonuclease